MSGAEWVSIIAAIGTAVSAILAGLVVLLRRDVKETQEQVRDTQEQVEEVHHIVNQERTDSVAYRLLLTDTLRRAGVKVPVDPSVDTPTP